MKNIFCKYNCIYYICTMQKDKYSLIKIETGNKAARFHYTVVDKDGNIKTERKSNRDYVACTINGQYYFGRIDLIGKGEHGRQIKWCQDNGKQPFEIAYLKTI